MAPNAVLADSSFYIRSLQERRDPLRELAGAAMTRDVVICGVVRCEVGRGLRDPNVRQRFHAAWDVMINVLTDNRLWEHSEKMLWDLGRNGITIPLTDAVIACCALRVGAVVLTHDHHFKLIPGLLSTDRLM